MIEKYADLFHDGTIHDIKHVKNNIKISMESAQLLPEWNEDNIKLSKHDTIAGDLHLEEVKNITIDGVVFKDILKKIYDSSDLYDFEIQKNKVILLVSWINYPPKPREETDIFTIEIEAGKIYWENIPMLSDADWDAL